MPSGNRPVIIALHGDSLTNVVGQLMAAGGAGNVILARSSDLVILPIQADMTCALEQASSSARTIGAFVNRLLARVKPGLDEMTEGAPGIDDSGTDPVARPILLRCA